MFVCTTVCLFVVVSESMCVRWAACVVEGGTLTNPPLKAHSYCKRRSCEILIFVEFSSQHKIHGYSFHPVCEGQTKRDIRTVQLLSTLLNKTGCLYQLM